MVAFRFANRRASRPSHVLATGGDRRFNEPRLSQQPTNHLAQRMMDGTPHGSGRVLSSLTAVAEPLYASAVWARNRLYDAGVFRAHPLPRPVISVGNITTGGTGKTPVIRWLAEALRGEGRQVAILSRGYKAAPGTLGDELTMLDCLLNGNHSKPPVVVRASADRVAGGVALLRQHGDLDVILLDDGFQHRRLARDLDVVLLSAVEPFGYGRVLPRGLLREPLGAALRRAGAIVITHADRADAEGRARIDQTVRRHQRDAPVYFARHVHRGYRSASNPAADEPDIPLSAMRGKRWYAFSGLGDPRPFYAQLDSAGGDRAGISTFRDHHDYVPEEIERLRADARAARADVVVTTEKDWVKVARHATSTDPTPGPPIWRAELAIEFEGDGETRLLEQVREACRSWGSRGGR